ncbi:MAG: hypothetical protein ACK4TC_17710 [Sphingomonas pseudosanguinis]|uniref:hypothetical protein n=2 Tax=Sphingomonas pseudosanguinis TaxID=413712 RepID=UPI00391D3979
MNVIVVMTVTANITRTVEEDDMTSTFAAWSRQTVLSPIARPAIQRPTIGLTIRVMPAVFKWQPVVIEPGEPRAQINLTHAAFRYPDPFDSDRNPTPACRDFVMQAVRDAARRDARKMWITWPDRSSTAFIGPDLTPTHQPSS